MVCQSVGLSFIDHPLKDSLKGFIEELYISINLRIIRRQILLPRSQLLIQLKHHLILEVNAMISDNLFRNTKV